MVEDRLSDGVRIAQLLASELDGRGGELSAVAVSDADPEVEPTVDGARAYAVTVDRGGAPEGGERTDLAAVYVQPERARLEFLQRQEAAAEAAEAEGLRVRPAATRPPRTLVFVEDGAEVKRAAAVVAAVAGG